MGKSATAAGRPQFSPDALREFRRAADLTQRELADLLWCRLMTVSDWERGLSAPQPANLRALAQALGVEIRDLLKDTASAGSGRR